MDHNCLGWEETRLAKKVWMDDAKETIHALFLVEDCEALIGQVSVEWSDQMTACLGKFKVRYEPDGPHFLGDTIGTKVKLSIVLSFPLWCRASEEERYRTAIHEAAHATVYWKSGAVLKGVRAPEPHGLEWFLTMLRAGVPPERCHHVDRTGLKRKLPRWPYACERKCTVYWLTKIRIRKMREGKKYRCRWCRGEIKPISNDEAARITE